MNIYLSNETSFTNNGLGFLTDVLSAKVTENLNGDMYLELTYPINGKLSEYLQEENIIRCNTGNNNYQSFRIKRVVKDYSLINVYAIHIFYDLLDNFLLDVAPTNKNCTTFGQWILNNTNFNNNFTFYSDIANTKSARYVRRNPIEAIIGDIDNSMINLFGGDLERDNYTIKLLSHRGSNTNKKLIFGKNIKEIKITKDITSTFTRILPLGFDGLMIPEIYVDSPLINEYQTPKIGKVEFSDIKYDPEDEEAYHTLEEAYQALRDATNKLYLEGIDKPSINIKIDWLELSKTNEYRNYQALETIYLGDNIETEILGLNYTTRVIKTVYDVLTDTIEKFEIGSITKSITKSVNDNNKKVDNINVVSILESAKNNASQLITTAMGGYIYKTQSELFIMDTDNPATAQKVWRWNMNGLGYSSTGINGEYGLAMTQDGSIVADYITTGTINTSLIEGYGSIEVNVNTIMNNVDEAGNITSVKTTNGFTFDENGLNINTSENEFNTQITPTSMQHKNGNDIITETSKDGFMTTDLNVKDQHFYSYDGTNYKMVAERVENDGEYCFAHFYNGN